MSGCQFTALLALVIPVLAGASTNEPKSVVVMPLKSKSVSAGVLRVLDDLMVVGADEISGMRVVSRDDIQAQLGLQQMKDALTCDDVQCAAEIGGALGAQFLLTGAVRKLGGKIFVTLSLIDTDKQIAIKRGKSKFEDNEEQYDRAIEAALRDLFGKMTSSPPIPDIRSHVPETIDVDRETLPTLQGDAVSVCSRWYQRDSTASFEMLARMRELRRDCERCLGGDPQGCPGLTPVEIEGTQWIPCPMGMGGGVPCSGHRNLMVWSEALEACPKPFRLPTADEYRALLKCSHGDSDRCVRCADSTECSALGTLSGNFWSSTSRKEDNPLLSVSYVSSVTVANFDHGKVRGVSVTESSGRPRKLGVWCVRGKAE